MYPGLITKMHRNPKTDLERFYNLELYHKCMIAIKLPIHKRIAKEKFRSSFEVADMLDHLYDLFQHIGKRLATANYKSVTKGCQKTILKFSKKLKSMMKTKGDFYLPTSRSRSREGSKSKERSPINTKKSPKNSPSPINPCSQKPPLKSTSNLPSPNTPISSPSS